MRIAWFNSSGEVSGAEITLLQTVHELATRGIDVRLIVPENGELVSRARGLGVPVRTGRFAEPRMTENVMTAALRVGSLAGLTTRLGRMVRSEGVDIVRANSMRAGLMATFAAPIHGRPVVWNVRDFTPEHVVGLGVRAVASLGAARVITNSSAVRKNFARWPGLARITRVVYPGIPASAWIVDSSSDSVRAGWRLTPDEFLIGDVGQITPWKRVHDGVRAFELVARTCQRARLVIVGAAKFRAENRTYLDDLHGLVRRLGLEERVHFVGFQDRMEPVFHALDVLLHPSEREPFGRVLIEAMAQGVPVVATRDGGIPEIVQDGESGFLVDVGDVTTMADRVLRLERDSNLRHSMGRRGRETARAFAWDRLIPLIIQTYQEILQTSSRFPVRGA